MGNGFAAGNAFFRVAGGMSTDYAEGVFDASTGLVKFRNCCWFTNIDHGRRHQPLQLMTMSDNLKFNKKLRELPTAYHKYDNYDAIEVPYTDAIPNDYEEVMGVPISFLDKHCPEQFEIVGFMASHGKVPKGMPNEAPYMNGKWLYNRILIRKKQ